MVGAVIVFHAAMVAIPVSGEELLSIVTRSNPVGAFILADATSSRRASDAGRLRGSDNHPPKGSRVRETRDEPRRLVEAAEVRFECRFQSEHPA